MLLRQLFDVSSGSYSYLLADNDSREALIIDPVLDQVSSYCQLITELQLHLIMAIDTHVHADHITGMGRLRDIFQCKTMLGEEAHVQCVSETVSDQQIITLGKIEIRAIYTPGHTQDSYCFYSQYRDNHYLFSGDTLLIRATGRTDFQGGDSYQQYNSLFDKILSLPDETIVYPGHDYNGMTVSTIYEEKRFNPRLQATSAEEYASIMGKLNLPPPKQMLRAVPANLECGKVLP